MAQFESHRGQIEKVGTVVFIAAQKRGGIVADPEKFFVGRLAGFPFLLDEDRAVTKQYGVYIKMAMDSINIARPATLIVGQDRVIRYIYVGDDQTDRAPIEIILERFSAAK